MDYKYNNTASGFSHRQYVAAVAMNNIAVSLLERCSLNEAQETFHGSLALMNITTRQDQDDLIATISEAQHDVNRMQLQAEAALARASKPHDRQHGGFLLTVLSDDHTATAMEDAAYDICSANTGYAVRIDHENIEDCYYDYDFHLHLAIILMNYSVACRCTHYYQEPVRRINISHLTTAFHYSSAADAILSSLEDDLDNGDDEDNRSRYSGYLLLHMIVVQNLMALSRDDDSFNPQDRHIYYDKLCRLRDELPCRKNMIPTSYVRSQAPAA